MDTQTHPQQRKSTEVSLKDLLEAGAHFGHQTHRWNPKMKRFILEERNGLHIIDLAKTMQQIRKAVSVAKEVASKHQPILFVGTKKQAKSVIKEIAEMTGEYYICERWLGGMLTNHKTIRQSIKKLERIEKQIQSGAEHLKKKELILLAKYHAKLDKNLSGIRSMRKLPGLIVVVDTNREHLAVSEATKLGIPVMGLVDTNCNPDPIQHVIACNDDAIKSVRIVLEAIGHSILEAKSDLNILAAKQEKEAAE